MTSDRKKLSNRRNVFLVVAAAAPLAALVGDVPLAPKLGNEPGLPGAFVLATTVLLCFAAGHTAMSREVINSGVDIACDATTRVEAALQRATWDGRSLSARCPRGPSEVESRSGIGTTR